MEKDTRIFVLDRLEDEARMWADEASIALSQLTKATTSILADGSTKHIPKLNKSAEGLIKQKKKLGLILEVLAELRRGPMDESFHSQCESLMTQKREYDEYQGMEWKEWKEIVGDDGDLGSGISIVKNTVSLTCPITLKLYEDPYTNPGCGHSYSKKAIYSLAGKKKSIKCPVIGCNVAFDIGDLIPGTSISRRLNLIGP